MPTGLVRVFASSQTVDVLWCAKLLTCLFYIMPLLVEPPIPQLCCFVNRYLLINTTQYLSNLKLVGAVGLEPTT